MTTHGGTVIDVFFLPQSVWINVVYPPWYAWYATHEVYVVARVLLTVYPPGGSTQLARWFRVDV